MAVRKEKNGTWTAHVSFYDAETKKYSYRKKRGFQYKREALEWIASIKTEKPVDSLGSFESMLTKYEAYSQCSNGMKEKRRQVLYKRFSDFMDRPIQSITKAQLTDWRSNLWTMDLGTRTKNTTLQYVRCVFRFANEFYDMPDVSSCLRQFKMTDEEVLMDRSVWDPEEFNQFLTGIPEDRKIYRIFFEMLFWTGLRRGEAIAIQKDLIDGDEILIKYSYRNSTEGLKPTKTRQRRKVRIDSTLLKDIQPLMRIPGPFLFGGYEPLTPTTIKRVFDDAIKESGVKPIRIHDLRHSHATWLINSGCNIVAVSKRLGHSSIEQTLKTYTHLLEQTDDALFDTISKAHK